MVIFRRTFLFWLFAFWQGGFFFYASVVVKVGTDLTSQFDQGLITRQVTFWLNLSGLIVLLAWIWDLLVERSACLKRRWVAWALMLIALAILAGLHPQLDGLIDDENYRLFDRRHFRLLHRIYLHVSTLQWLVSIAFTFWTLQSWRATDIRSSTTGLRPGPPGK